MSGGNIRVLAVCAPQIVQARGGKPLSAYVVVSDGMAPTADELRCYLRTKLPEHMVPAANWRVEKMPLLPRKTIENAVGRKTQL
jgi:hypothetical protein